MTTYEVTHSNGTRTTTHTSERAAKSEIYGIYGGVAFIHDDWQAAGYTRAGREIERLLVWPDEASSEDDGGSHAVASIRRYETGGA